jgi:hypothetical protein
MWIKPSELPPRFHGECWVCWRNQFSGIIYPPNLRTVQNYYRGTCAEYWHDDGYYRGLPDKEYRVMVLDIPEAPEEEDW